MNLKLCTTIDSISKRTEKYSGYEIYEHALRFLKSVIQIPAQIFPDSKFLDKPAHNVGTLLYNLVSSYVGYRNRMCIISMFIDPVSNQHTKSE